MTVPGTSSSLTHQALEHREVFSTGRKTGSELPTTANGDGIRSEPLQVLFGFIVKEHD